MENESKCCGNCKNSGIISYLTKDGSHLTTGAIIYTKCSYTRSWHNINDKNDCFNIFYTKK